MNINVFLPILVAFVLTLIIGMPVIKFLRKMKMRQTERSDGVASHLQKVGTPTMGGIIIIAALVLTSVFYIPNFPQILPVLILTVGFGIIGFLDDYLKVVKKHPDGLKSGQKMILQILITAVFAVFITYSEHISMHLLIPFGGGRAIELGWFAYVLLFVAVIGTVNGTNFTDGLDGLASSVTVVVAAFFTVVSILLGQGVAPFTAAMIGALLGFLVFNVYPAKIFMGDTGSLALGGFVIGTAYVMDMPLFVIIIGLIYVIEVASVMIQVVYFKKTGGKRFFKMAPIHHHFELMGWSETRVVAVFTIITLFLCMVAFMGVV
ncbi:MAG: phospho-N-acetylmuramoyl-pentapeptide-transferase [Lachnospiraceae bacterium]|nr:phospho-N-acetylmuramoyl-pentapeptide-transferase [Lachnospiraceae bacterium]